MIKTYTKNSSQSNLTLSDFNICYFEDNYMLKMITNNHIEGLLDSSLTLINSNPVINYNITSKHSLSSVLTGEKVDYSLLTNILSGLYNVCVNLEKYLLDDRFILTDPDFIFVNPETKKVSFCYCPIEEENINYSFVEGLKNLLDFLITKLNYEIPECVSFCYYVHQKCVTDTFVLKDLINTHKIIKKDIEIKEPFSRPDTNFDTSDNEEEPSSFTDIASELPRFEDLLKYLLGGVSAIIVILGSVLYFAKVISIYIFAAMILSVPILIFLTYPSIKKQKEKKEYFSDHSRPAQIKENDINPNIKVHPEPIGDTILLTDLTEKSNPSLIYTGTDFKSTTPLDTFPFTIGKIKDSSNLVIDSPLISRIHARIYEKENCFYIEDLNSSNGTFINSRMISPHSMIKINDGDLITFAKLTYLFKLS